MTERINFVDIAEELTEKIIEKKLEEANRQAIELENTSAVIKAGELFRLKNFPTPYLSMDDEDLTQRK